MEIFVPDYYEKFKCIADQCKHTCCLGWEIDIDEASFARYMAEEGEMGARLRESIFTNGEGAHFRLSEGDRCPFLNDKNLCDLILHFGEDALCRICRDHPRYRNFFESRTEVGLGLSCEAAARLILEGEKRPEMVALGGAAPEETEEEATFFAFRESLLDMVFTDKPLRKCMADIAEKFGLSIPEPSFDFYTSLSVLHDSWTEKLSLLRAPMGENQETHMAAKRLFAYFVYRHLADLYFEGREAAGVAFCLYAVKTVLNLSADMADFLDTARRFSEEIEYDTDNVQRIINMLEI
ncbi:MAG: flagellin lysine-N-methylase [Clostridia bacterium]|nr:flagellin lysine-N-methylase [Clostridia bacterium]